MFKKVSSECNGNSMNSLKSKLYKMLGESESDRAGVAERFTVLCYGTHGHGFEPPSMLVDT